MIGISIYFHMGIKKNLEIIKEAQKHGIYHIFTSLHIPEGNLSDCIEEIKDICKYCYENQIEIYADVSSETVKLLNLNTFEELEQFGITGFRFDYGFTEDEIIKISEKHKIIFNASTLDRVSLELYRRKGMNFNNVIACHNYYPKIHKCNILGTEGMISIDASHHNMIQRYTEKDVIVPDVIVQNSIFNEPKGFAFESINSFINQLVTGEEFYVTIEDAAKVSLAILGIMESAKSRMPVDIRY